MTDRPNPLQKTIDEHKGQMAAVPLAHYEEVFAKADPLLLAARSGIPFTWLDNDEDDDAAAEQREHATAYREGVFNLRLLGRPMEIRWPSMKSTYFDSNETPSTKERIIVVDLLLHGQVVPATGKFIRYTDVPWGDHYFKAFEGRCINRLAHMYRNKEDFCQACERLGGTPTSDGDASYDFDFIGGVMIRLTIWEADDEFPASAQILFSDNAALAFNAEDLAVMGDITLNALKRLSL